jgi:excisionase family DNA binding protein
LPKSKQRIREKNYVTNATHPQTDYMSVAEVATALGLCKMTVYRMCQSGQLAHIRTGLRNKTYRILRASFEQHATPTVAPAPAVIPGQTEITA